MVRIARVTTVRNAQGKYSPRRGAYIVDQTASGESLAAIAAQIGIAKSTVFGWLRHRDEQTRPGFFAAFNAARQIRYEILAAEVIEIADDCTGNIDRDRLRIDNRKWLLCKMRPDRYGDRAKTKDDGPTDLVARLSAARSRAIPLTGT
jgi:transposase-like protein